MRRLLISFCVIVALVIIESCEAGVTVTVDPSNGNDTRCFSAQDLVDMNISMGDTACRTLNRALGVGSVPCVNVSCENGTVSELDGVLIRLADGEHRLTACVGLSYSSNITFEAINEGRASIMCANDSNAPPNTYDNIFFCYSLNISFVGIQFEGCGPFSANVFMFNVSGISIQKSIFRRNIGSPLQIRFGTGIELRSCHFIENMNMVSPPPDDENTTITSTFNTITTSGGFTFFTKDLPTDITIQDCIFSSNAASNNPPNNSRPVLLKAAGHGGAILLRFTGSNNSRVRIESCIFENNTAQVDGGSVYVSLSQFSSNNQFILRNNTFIDNSVKIASGGAVSINFYNFTYENNITVEGSNFSLNRGNSGGAFSMALYDSNLVSTSRPDVLILKNCMFHTNYAMNEGTAVGLFSLVHVDQVGFRVFFEDCTFVNNTSLEAARDTSAIAAFRFPTVFSGYNLFRENIGGGITLLNTRMRAMANSVLVFQRNTAVFGGGIAMDDRCLLEISNDMSMIFEENVATESGGGIYVEFPPIRFVVDIFNRLCFLQYNNGSGIDAPPQEWNNVLLNFTGNRARLSGAAIFASDMQQCSWLGSEFTNNSTLIFKPPQQVLDLSPNYPFQYSNNRLFPEGQTAAILSDENLATSPANILVTVNYMQDFLVQPGETLQINLLATDQVNNSREAIWSREAPATAPNLDALSGTNGTYPYMIPSAGNLTGIQDMMSIPDNFSSSFTLNFSLLRTLGTVQPLNLRVSGCHPGYFFDKETGTCTCESTNEDILRCDDSDSRYVYLREGIWGGNKREDGVRRLITARVQLGYVSCRPQGRLPGCLFEFDNTTAQCREGRKGNLCGECTEGRGVTLDLRECTSTPCYIGLVVFLILCVLVVVLSMLILLFNIPLPNELKGFIFYAQVIGLIYSPYVTVRTDLSSDRHTENIRIFLNLLGLSVPLPLCISPDWKAHYVALLGYISPLLSILCMVLFVLGTRFIRALGSRSALKGITFIFLFIYKYVADTSFIFLNCLSHRDLGVVFQYDGSQLCTAPEFAVFAIIGLILVAFFIVPTPFLVSYICIRRPQRFQQYADVLTYGLRLKHRWWGGWDIARRLPFVFINFFTVLLRPSLVLFLMSLAALGVLLVHLFTKPFQKMYINIIEAAILLDLLLVTVAFLDPSNSPIPFGFSITLALLPYLYAACYIFYTLFGKKLWRKISAMKQQKERAESAVKDQDGGDGTRDTNQTDSSTTAGTNRTEETRSTGADKTRAHTHSSSDGAVEEMDFTHLREPLLDDF